MKSIKIDICICVEERNKYIYYRQRVSIITKVMGDFKITSRNRKIIVCMNVNIHFFFFLSQNEDSQISWETETLLKIMIG